MVKKEVILAVSILLVLAALRIGLAIDIPIQYNSDYISLTKNEFYTGEAVHIFSKYNESNFTIRVGIGGTGYSYLNQNGIIFIPEKIGNYYIELEKNDAIISNSSFEVRAANSPLILTDKNEYIFGDSVFISL